MAYSNQIPSYHDLRALSIVWMRAIALAWEYHQNMSTYTGVDQKKAQNFLNLLESDTQLALAQYFNYQCPFSINLSTLWSQAMAPQNAKYTATTEGQWVPYDSPTPGYWENLPPNQIYFHVPFSPNLPTAPSSPSPMGNESIALAAYLDSGSCYLFSCC